MGLCADSELRKLINFTDISIDEQVLGNLNWKKMQKRVSMEIPAVHTRTSVQIENPDSRPSDQPLQDRTNLIDRRFFPHLVVFNIVSDADDFLQILSVQSRKGTLFPGTPLN